MMTPLAQKQELSILCKGQPKLESYGFNIRWYEKCFEVRTSIYLCKVEVGRCSKEMVRHMKDNQECQERRLIWRRPGHLRYKAVWEVYTHDLSNYRSKELYGEESILFGLRQHQLQNFHRFVVLCICWDTPCKNTSCWQLPNVSSAFAWRTLSSAEYKQNAVLTREIRLT